MTSHLALVINSPVNGTHNIQTVIVPAFSLEDCLHRETDGSRGRGSAWQTVNTHELTEWQIGNSTVTSVINAFSISDRDLAALKAGIATSVGIKALASLNDSAGTVEDTAHWQLVSEVNELVLAGSSSELTTLLMLAGVKNTNIPAFPKSPQVQSGLAVSTVNPSEVIAQPSVANIGESGKSLTAFAPTELVVSTNSPRMELATVPDAKWAANYINRKVLGDKTEFDIYDQAIADEANVLITGHAGSGKTMSVMAYAHARNMRFYSVSSHAGIEVSQVFGKWNPTGNPDVPYAWQDGGLTECVRNGNAVLLLNEVNMLPERFTTVIFSLLDARREISLMDKDGEVVRAAPNLLIVGDMNPNYRGTRQLNQAWNDRFCQHRIEFPYDSSIEAKLVPNKGLLDMAAQLRMRFEKDEISTPISTRSLVAFHKNTMTLGLDYAIYSYLNLFTDMTERNAVSLVIESHKSHLEAGIPNAVK